MLIGAVNYLCVSRWIITMKEVKYPILLTDRIVHACQLQILYIGTQTQVKLLVFFKANFTSFFNNNVRDTSNRLDFLAIVLPFE